MKARGRLLTVLNLVLLSTPLLAEDTERTIRKNPFVEGQYDIYEGGSRVGSARQNPFRSDTLDVLDEKGRTQESVRESPFVEDQYDVQKDGQRTGTIRENPFIEGQYDVRDEHGHEQGEVRKDPFIQDQWTGFGED